MADAPLPLGWTLQQIRERSGDQEAVALDPNRAVTWVGGAATEAKEALRPEIVLGFHDLCLVRTVDHDWYMGSLYEDGSIDCWAGCNSLDDGLRGL
ncbi:hypothetical protein AB8A21_16855 [Streptomyces sp. BF23-18]|uniref:hypothetical protein n=1 Tax=Streptomyces sp. BF23-18 TaxID=3240282 RepID=UPI0034E3FA1C